MKGFRNRAQPGSPSAATDPARDLLAAYISADDGSKLRTPFTDLIAEDTEAGRRAHEQLEGLRIEVLRLTEPYTAQLEREVPALEQPKRRLGWLLGLKPPATLHPHFWQVPGETGALGMDYRFCLWYAQRTPSDRLKSVTMVMAKESDAPSAWTTPENPADEVQQRGIKERNPAPKLEMIFAGDEMAKLSVSWEYGGPAVLLELAQGSSLGALLQEDFVLDDRVFDHTSGELTVDLRTPGIIINQKFVARRPARIERKLSYLYDPGSHTFIRQNDTKGSGGEEGSDGQKKMLPEEFMELVHDVLQLIPMTGSDTKVSTQ